MSCSQKSKILLDGQELAGAEDRSVLEALENAGVEWPSGCKNGVCGSCKMSLLSGEIVDKGGERYARKDLENGEFLACSFSPKGAIEVSSERPEDELVEATLKRIEKLADDIIEVTLQCCEAVQGRPGQFLNLQREDGLQRCYSIAGISEEDQSEVHLHVKLYQNGEMSSWLAEGKNLGMQLGISEPKGNCFYKPEFREQNILLIGTGTGLAPLYGVVMDAVADEHAGRIVLFHGSRHADGVYMHQQMQQLAESIEGFEYFGCVSSEPCDGFEFGRADEKAFEYLSALRGWRVFLCGHPEMVMSAQKRAFLAGAGMGDIYCDPFTPAGGEVVSNVKPP
jgi:ferredoxin-NADP reductase